MVEPFLNNRELAGLILLAALVTYALGSGSQAGRLRAVGDILSSLGGILSSVASLKVLFPTLLYIGVMVAALVPASRVGLWEQGLWHATGSWIAISGFGLLFSIGEAMRQPGFFRRALFRSVGVIALVEFIANLESFALWLEVPAQGLALFALAVRSLDTHPRAARAADAYLLLLGLSAIAWGVWKLAVQWAQVDHQLVLLEFLLPIWMTPVALLVVFAYAVWSSYERVFVVMRWAAKGKPLWAQRMALVLRCGAWLPHLRIANNYGAAWRIGRTRGFREAWAEIPQIRQEHHQRAEEEAAAARRLVENAGLVGVDDFGRQLDQREHAETKSALRRLASMQMGRYRNTGKYQGDLLAASELALLREEFLGIDMHVTSDGQCGTPSDGL